MSSNKAFQEAYENYEEFRKILKDVVKDLEDYKETKDFASLFSYNWSLITIDYPELCAEIIKAAIKAQENNIKGSFYLLQIIASIFEDISEEISCDVGLKNYGIDHIVRVFIKNSEIVLTLNNGMELGVFSFNPNTIYLLGTNFKANFSERDDCDTRSSLYIQEFMKIGSKEEIEISLSKSDLFSDIVDLNLNYIIRRYYK